MALVHNVFRFVVTVLNSVALPAAHLLIVDDNAQEQFLLKEMLRGHDFVFSAARNSNEAFELALQNPPDIVLAALYPSGHDVMALESRLHAHPSTEDIPLLFLATAKHLAGRSDLVRTEVVDYLIKPFTVGQLVERVQAQLRLSFLLRENGRKRRDVTGPGVREDWELIGRAKKYLDEHLAQVRRLADVATALSVTERRLIQVFQNCLGLSAVEYIRGERMRKAKQLLAHTTLSVGEVARAVGFSSAANFSTAFNNWVGASPSSFRNQALSNALTLDRSFK